MKKVVWILAFTGIFAVGTLHSQWSQLPGESSHRCLAICATTDALIAATQDSNILRSTDQGLTWTRSGAGIQDSILASALWSKGDTVYVGTNEGGFISEDDGTHWTKIDVGPASSQQVYAYLRREHYLFMTGDSGVFRSSDNGQGWQSSNVGLPAGMPVYSMAADDEYLYIGTYRHAAFRSSDNGEHWEPSSTGMQKTPIITALWANGGNLVALKEGGQWFRSQDRGSNWTLYTSSFVPLGGVATAYCTLPYPDVVFCGADYGVIRSTDFGKTWEAFKFGPPCHVVSMCTSGGYLYAATPEQWIWRRPLSEILPPSSVDAPASPYALRLSQSTPNPVITNAEISYTLPSYAPVTLKLYNAMMQEVSTIVEGPQEAGEHTVAVNARALPSGVYYYRLSNGASTLTRRMVVVK